MSDISKMTAEQANASTQVIRAAEKMNQATDVVANASANRLSVGGRSACGRADEPYHPGSIGGDQRAGNRQQADPGGSREQNTVTGQVSIAPRAVPLRRQIVVAVTV